MTYETEGYVDAVGVEFDESTNRVVRRFLYGLITDLGNLDDRIDRIIDDVSVILSHRGVEVEFPPNSDGNAKSIHFSFSDLVKENGSDLRRFYEELTKVLEDA